MAKNYYFSGVGKWAKVHSPDEKFDVYVVDLYMDEPSWELYEQSGIQLKVKEDGDGNKFVKFKRRAHELRGDQLVENGPPKVVDKDGNLINDLVGNGSELILKVEVFNGKNGVGHRLEGVMVKELVPYDGEGGPAEDVKPEGMDEIPEF